MGTAVREAVDYQQEVMKCALSPVYFVNEYVQILDPQVGYWFPFRLWDAQREVLHLMHTQRQIVALKARQIGMTTLALSYALWRMLFCPVASVLLFSRRDEEAKDMLVRLKDMLSKLPAWLQPRALDNDNAHVIKLSNGSVARAFPTTGGDAYTATLVVIDEADLMPNFSTLLRSAKPTVDNGGQLFILGRPDKDKPHSEFKRIYRAAKERRNEWTPLFLAWHARPDRDAAWYERQRRDFMADTGSLDGLYEQYPATDAEALATKTLNKYFPPEMVLGCYAECAPIAFDALPEGAPLIAGMTIYKLPEKGAYYCGGVDTAEGNPTSDDSAAVILDAQTGEQVAELSGKFQPDTLGAYATTLAAWYNNAPLLVERNNHGHAVLLWMRDNRPAIRRAWGKDGKEGWLTNSLGKTLLYDKGIQLLKERSTTIHSFKAFTQIGSIEGSSLSAPAGEMDDVSMAYMLALQLVGKLGVFVG